MEEGFETTNIHLKWLENIYNQLKIIQDMERIGSEGCKDLMDYFQIPFDAQRIMMPDAQYKNVRFMVLEINILISNLSPVLKGKEKEYEKRLAPILKSINDRKLFLKEIKRNRQIVDIIVLPFLITTLDYLISIKSDIIKDISSILYLPENESGWKK